MSKPCKYCGEFYKDEEELRQHESNHRNLDRQAVIEQERVSHYPEIEANHDQLEQVHGSISSEKPSTKKEQSCPKGFTCDTCHRTFKAKSSLVRHIKAKHSNETFKCGHCFRAFNRNSSRNRHQVNCQGPAPDRPASFACRSCGKIFKWPSNRNRHQNTCKGSEHVCQICQKRCSTAHGLQRHIKAHQRATKQPSPTPSHIQAHQRATKQLSPTPSHIQAHQRATKQPSPTPSHIQAHQRATKQPSPTPGTSSARSSQFRCRRCTAVFANRRDLYLHGMSQHYNQTGEALQNQPWGQNEVAPWDGDDALRQVYKANAPIILEPHRQGPIQSIYNLPVTNDLNLFNINQLTRFAQEIFEKQQRAFRLNMALGFILQNRETGLYRYFVPHMSSVIFERPVYISKRTDLQCLRQQMERKDMLTELLRQRPDTKWIPVLITNVNFLVTETAYSIGQGELPDYLMKMDSLYPLVKSRQTSKPYDDNLCAFRCLALHRGYDIKSLEDPSKQLFRQWSDKSSDTFEGLRFDEFPDFETRFNLNMEVYSLTEDGFARSIYKSQSQHATTMYVNLHENHMSFIRNFAGYAKKYQCKTCQRHFYHAGHFHRHQKVCSNKTKFVYPGGFYQARENIFERLDQYEINVPEDQRTFPWFVCYDFESILQKVNYQPTQCLEWTHKHVPISVSICSNVDGHTEPVCIIDADQDQLVQKMVSEMKDIANRVYKLAEDKWGWVLEAINQKLEEEKKRGHDQVVEDGEEIDEDEEDGSDDEDDKNSQQKEATHPLQTIYGQFEGYMSQVPVLGFNSAKYDLNLIKRCLAKHLNMSETKGTFVIKRNNAYTCISTASLKFLDMSHFLAAGSSYAGFLKAYHVTEQKGYFPYEWFSDVTKLEETSLPPRVAFNSQLKGTNISEEQYTYCQRIWREHEMTTFRDFLIYYNNLDVGPFVEAIEKFQHFYFKKGIDVFKTAISVPGIARQLLFKTARQVNANFALFGNKNKDLYQTVKQNVIGGPSIIFTRHHCTGKTLIRGQKPCGAILGFDANALYLQAIGQPMPVGPFVRRLADNNFQAELRDKYMSAFYWMDWLAHVRGVVIQHKLNTGREVNIGRYPVDGFVPAAQQGDKGTVFQFHGCYWHGHQCKVTQGIKDEKWLATRTEKYKRTQDTTAYLKREHYVEEMWECQFHQYRRQHPDINAFIDSKQPGFFQQHKGKITEDIILQGVDSGVLFGMVEVDIEVPEQWPSYFQHPTMTPFEYFEEMSPLFCNSEIPFDAIGEHMQAHIRDYHLSDKPRKQLVGGMKARQILMATPLLKWYRNHGLVVSKIYQVVEFQQQRCFQEFVREVSEARRQGDVDPNTAIIADTMKAIGNSGYGSLIMDKTKHRKNKYIQGENETCREVNDPRFLKLDCLDPEEQYYELEMAKRKIKLDLPIQLGYFILQYAKLRMLEFYYDFMDKYVDRADFEYCEMDTDSAYMAISGSCLDDVIKPEMKNMYRSGLKGFCTDVNIEADAQHHWFPRTCCEKHTKFDKRTPGLFKLEYQGDEMIGLCSKTYIVRKSKVTKPSNTRVTATSLLHKAKGLKTKPRPLLPRHHYEYKFSSKGVSKCHLTAPMTKFRQVLKTHKTQSSRNTGFRVRNNAVFTYTQERKGFSYLYCKRKVLDDGIHTVPLDIMLCPLPTEEQKVNDQELID